jgi:hypothetical protein
MALKALLFPRVSRTFPGKRWLNISLRTLHLIGVAGLGGAYLYAAPRELWAPYLWLSLGSGFGLVILSVFSNGIWLLQLRGLLILFKLFLLGVMLWLPGFSLSLGISVIVISSVIAHAPGDVRYYSIWHGRRIECL